MMPDQPDELITLTLHREHWHVLLYLAISGGKQALDQYVRGEGHTATCMLANANAVKALHDLLHPGVPMAPDESEAVH